jgi:hypothetical protein
MEEDFDQQAFEDAMLHKTKDEAVKAAYLLIANSEEGGQLTVHNAVEGLNHTDSSCVCIPDVYVIPPKKLVVPIH